MRVRTVEEFWPGQKDGTRTARIEALVDNRFRQVGRITVSDDDELFREMQELIEKEKNDCPQA